MGRKRRRAFASLRRHELAGRDDEIKHKDFCTNEMNTNQLQPEKKEGEKSNILARIEELEMKMNQLFSTDEVNTNQFQTEKKEGEKSNILAKIEELEMRINQHLDTGDNKGLTNLELKIVHLSCEVASLSHDVKQVANEIEDTRAEYEEMNVIKPQNINDMVTSAAKTGGKEVASLRSDLEGVKSRLDCTCQEVAKLVHGMPDDLQGFLISVLKESLETSIRALSGCIDSRFNTVENEINSLCGGLRALELKLLLHEEQLSLLRKMALGKDHWTNKI